MLDVSRVLNQSVGYLKAQKYCFFTRAWPGPPVIAVVEVDLRRMSVRTVSAQRMQPSEEGPQGLTPKS